MKKYLFIVLMLALVLTPVLSQATTNGGASTIAELQALIVKLQAQIKVLQQQQSQQKVAICAFSNDLSLGDGEGDGLTTEISALHKILIAGRFLNIPKPTGWYGKLTQSAVKVWQMKNGLPMTGAIGPKDRGVLCGDLVAVPVAPIVYPKVSDNASSLYFSSKFFDFGYTIGDSVSGVYNQQLIITNGSNYDVNVKISVNNQPSWLNTKYSNDTLTINPGQPLGFGVSVDPTGLSAGNYKTEIKISGDFAGSPKVIPVTLRIYNSDVQSPTATIDVGSLTSSSVYPVITGSAYNAPSVGISLSNSGGKIWGSGTVPVINNRWTIPITIALSAGSYTVDVYSNNVLLASGGLNVSTQAPTCVLTSNKSSYSLGENILFSWTSKNTNYASWQQDLSGKDTLSLPGDKLSANGSQYVLANVAGNPTVTLLVDGYSGTGSCSKTVNITSQ